LKKTKIIDLLDEKEDRNRELFKFKIVNKNAIQDLKHDLDRKISEYHDGDDFKDRFHCSNMVKKCCRKNFQVEFRNLISKRSQVSKPYFVSITNARLILSNFFFLGKIF